MKTIYLGADHAGFELKEKVKQWLKKKRIPFQDLGNVKYDQDDDYPDYAEKVGRQVVRAKSKGILFCGSAEGICIAANKMKGVRAVAVWDTRMAEQSRRHNDANVLCLSGGGTLTMVPGLGLPFDTAQKIINVWLTTPFSNAARHQRRIQKIKKLELRV
ncbi:MAG: RpiB/LacA/LacB family sugar-phosphate isomerase [Nanoarchaeota archaeon]|nr:RpiB/LacA/LacB family sugar-phosphate isomerase [Nanoarchaeota archaeon]